MPWALDEDRGNATVEDVCNFIVEYINSDVDGVSLPLLVLAPLSSFPLETYRASWWARNCRSIRGGTLFVYDLLHPYPSIGWRIQRLVQ